MIVALPVAKDGVYPTLPPLLVLDNGGTNLIFINPSSIERIMEKQLCFLETKRGHKKTVPGR